MLFTVKKEEIKAVKQFQHSCTYYGLKVILSLKSLNSLRQVIDSKTTKRPVNITDATAFTLERRGLIRSTSDATYTVTELGLLVAALAEAGGLVSFKA